jgi:hypothetical protein
LGQLLERYLNNQKLALQFSRLQSQEHTMTDQPEKPKTFNMHWGSGIIAEEAIHDGEHHRPTIQLMEFDDGSLSIQFCHYSHNGRFQRSPLIVGESEIDDLRAALDNTPRLKELLIRLTS